MRACRPDRDGYVDCDGVKVFYEVFGDANAPTVLLSHGWQVAPSALWKGQVPYLARHYRVVTWDWPGNGGSDRPDDLTAYSPLAIQSALQAVMAATCPAPPILVGISGGAALSLVQAAMAPESVSGAVLIGGPWMRPEDVDESNPSPFGELMTELATLAERLDDDDGWASFIERFWRLLIPEPHSTKLLEDGLAWARSADRAGLAPSMPFVNGVDELRASFEMLWALAPLITCPTLVVHGTEDPAASADRARELATLVGGDVVVIDGAGHCPHGRDPVAFNLLVRDFVDRVHPTRREQTIARPTHRPKRALFLCSPIGLGHARRDLAIADALRAERPDLQIDWLAQHPVTALLDARGERVHAASRALASESAHWESEAGEHDLHCFQALRRMDEILVANFMVFDDVVRDDRYDLVIADEAWDVDHFLHENPELKRFAYAWLTDFVGFVPMPEGGDAEAVLTADYNAEMLEQIARFPRVRDRALFVGEPADIIPDSFGPGLPSIADWTAQHFDFPGYITGYELRDRGALRAELGFRADETVCIITVGGSGIGVDLLRKAIAAHPIAARHVPSLRTIAVCGPRIDPASIDAPDGVEVLPFVPDLHRHLEACDLAIVQGGLTTCMELTAAGRPFLYFPLANHFEQQRHVPHRLDRHRAGRRMRYAHSTPESIAAELVGAVGAPVDYLPVASDGATRAARLLAELV